MHSQKNQIEVMKVIEFIKDYFEMFNKRVKLSFEEYKGWQNLPKEKIYDIVIDTADDETEKIAHACGWTYVTTKGLG
jgi:hypothetical protein